MPLLSFALSLLPLSLCLFVCALILSARLQGKNTSNEIFVEDDILNNVDALYWIILALTSASGSYVHKSIHEENFWSAKGYTLKDYPQPRLKYITLVANPVENKASNPFWLVRPKGDILCRSSSTPPPPTSGYVKGCSRNLLISQFSLYTHTSTL